MQIKNSRFLIVTQIEYGMRKYGIQGILHLDIAAEETTQIREECNKIIQPFQWEYHGFSRPQLLYACILFKDLLAQRRDPEFYFTKYTSIIKCLRSTSHRFRFFLALTGLITVFSALASIYEVVVHRSGINIENCPSASAYCKRSIIKWPPFTSRRRSEF